MSALRLLMYAMQLSELTQMEPNELWDTMMDLWLIRIIHTESPTALHTVVSSIPKTIELINDQRDSPSLSKINITTQSANTLYVTAFIKLEELYDSTRYDLTHLLNLMIDQNSKLNIKMDIRAWNTFFAQYFARNESFHRSTSSNVCQLIGKMHVNGSEVTPNLDTFNTILIAIVQNDFIKDATATVELVSNYIIKSYGITPNTRTVEAWMILYSKQRKYVEGVVLLHDICKELQIKETLTIGNLLIRLFEGADVEIYNETLQLLNETDRYLMLDMVMPYYHIQANNESNAVSISVY